MMLLRYALRPTSKFTILKGPKPIVDDKIDKFSYAYSIDFLIFSTLDIGLQHSIKL